MAVRSLEPRTFSFPHSYACRLDIFQRLPKRHPFLFQIFFSAFWCSFLDLAATVREIGVVVQRRNSNGKREELLATLVEDVKVSCDTIGVGIREGNVEGL